MACKFQDQLMKKAYELIHHGHQDSAIDLHSWQAAYPFLTSSSAPDGDLEAAARLFSRLDSNKDGKLEKIEFLYWFTGAMGGVSMDEMRRRVYHLGQVRQPQLTAANEAYSACKEASHAVVLHSTGTQSADST